MVNRFTAYNVMFVLLEVPRPGSFLCSFRFALSIACFLVTMNLYAQRIGISVAIVCMVNHTAVMKMRDAGQFSSSNNSNEGNLTTMTPSEWQTNESNDDAIKQLRSPCVGSLTADSNSSGSTVIIVII